MHTTPRRVGFLGLLYIAGRNFWFISSATKMKKPSVVEPRVDTSSRPGNTQTGRNLQSTLDGAKVWGRVEPRGLGKVEGLGWGTLRRQLVSS